MRYHMGMLNRNGTSDTAFSGRHLLLVEDSLPVLDLLCTYLEPRGYAITTATDGHGALELLEQEPFDLLLCDLKLDGPNGLEVIERANQILPDVPKILMTGNLDTQSLIRAIKLGVYDFIRKPIPKLPELELVIERALEHNRLLQEREANLEQIQQMNEQLSEMNRHLEEEVLRRTRDLSEANAQLRTLDEMKNNLLANVSHELRTPLVSVRGYTELFLRGHLGPMPEGSGMFLESSLRNIDKLLSLIESLVEYADMAREKLPLSLQYKEIHEVISTLAKDYAPRAREAGFTFHALLPESRLWVYIDTDRFFSSFRHILDNALKFNPPQTEIRIHAERLTKTLLKIAVSDTGIGIPIDAQGHIFERFFQIDNSPTRKHGGTGMGLAIARDNLRLMGCELRVNSEPGHGSTFYWTIPCTDTPPRDAPTQDILFNRATDSGAPAGVKTAPPS